MRWLILLLVFLGSFYVLMGVFVEWLNRPKKRTQDSGSIPLRLTEEKEESDASAGSWRWPRFWL